MKHHHVKLGLVHPVKWYSQAEIGGGGGARREETQVRGMRRAWGVRSEVFCLMRLNVGHVDFQLVPTRPSVRHKTVSLLFSQSKTETRVRSRSSIPIQGVHVLRTL